MLLEGKKLLITGVLTPQSIAFAAAKAAQEQGAEIVLTNFGRTVSLTQKTAKRLPSTPDVLEMDANSDEQIAAVCDELRRRWGRLDGFLHAIAFAPQDALGGNFLHTPWESVAKAGLEAVTRYLARDLGPKGIRVNAVSAGPIKTMAGKGIPGFDQISGSWARRAPLGWDVEDPTPVGNAVAFLLSDLSSGITASSCTSTEGST